VIDLPRGELDALAELRCLLLDFVRQEHAIMRKARKLYESPSGDRRYLIRGDSPGLLEIGVGMHPA
jgi:hypothetical protein